MPFKLEEIKLKEIGLVNAAANRKKFLIIKQNGVEKMQCQKCGHILKQDEIVYNSLNQLKCSECGTLLLTTLNKESEMENLKKLFKDFCGEEISEKTIEFIKTMKEESVKAIEKSFATIAKYKDDMPEDLIEAVSVLGKYSVDKGQPYSSEKEEELQKKVAELEKAGKKISKDTEKIIKEVVKTLIKLLPEGEDFGKQETELDVLKKEHSEQIQKMQEDFTKKLDEIVKGFKESAEASEKAAKSAAERIEKLEKIKGIKKGLDKDDDDDDDVKKSADDHKWPSFDFLDGE